MYETWVERKVSGLSADVIGDWTEVGRRSTLTPDGAARSGDGFRNMKSTIFVRPNLKLIFVGALLVIVVQHLIISGHSQGWSSSPLPVNASEFDSDDLRELLKRAVAKPTSAAYMRLSACFEKRGDYRKALIYLRRADQLRESEDSAE